MAIFHKSDFIPISGDCGELGIPKLAWMSLIKIYLMLQHARFTAFTVSKLLKQNQQGAESKNSAPQKNQWTGLYMATASVMKGLKRMR